MDGGRVLNRRGMNYDFSLWSPPWVGTLVPPVPSALERARREFAILRDDLHCNA